MDKIPETHNETAVRLRELRQGPSESLPLRSDAADVIEDSATQTTASSSSSGPSTSMTQSTALSSNSRSSTTITQTTASCSNPRSSSLTASEIQGDCDNGASFRPAASSLSRRSIRFNLPPEALKKSRPYKLLRQRHGVDPDSQSVFSKHSLATEGGTDMSLGDLSISEISVLKLPISVSDLYDPAPYQVARRRQNPALKSVKWSSRGRLHSAIEGSNLSALRAMLNLGADIEETKLESLDRTPLLYAAMRGHLRACQMLLENGAAVQLTDQLAERDCRMPLSIVWGYASCC